MNADMNNAIRICWECRHTCQETLYKHCLVMGGKHLEASHLKAMFDCIQICQTSADFMVRGSDLHGAVCAACAEICEACAESCKKFDTKEMDACAEACLKCAISCRDMAKDSEASQFVTA